MPDRYHLTRSAAVATNRGLGGLPWPPFGKSVWMLTLCKIYMTSLPDYREGIHTIHSDIVPGSLLSRTVEGSCGFRGKTRDLVPVGLTIAHCPYASLINGSEFCADFGSYGGKQVV